MHNVFKLAVIRKKIILGLGMVSILGEASVLGNKKHNASARSQTKNINLARSSLYSTMRFFDGEGREHSLKKFSGSKPTLVVVWASWCGPCIKEMPSVERLKNSEFGKQINVVPISLEKPSSGHRCSLEGITMPLYYSEGILSFLAQEGLEGIPAVLLYDEKGNLVFKEVGAQEWDRPHAIGMISKALNLSAKSGAAVAKRRK